MYQQCDDDHGGHQQCDDDDEILFCLFAESWQRTELTGATVLPISVRPSKEEFLFSISSLLHIDLMFFSFKIRV